MEGGWGLERQRWSHEKDGGSRRGTVLSVGGSSRENSDRKGEIDLGLMFLLSNKVTKHLQIYLCY